MTITKNSLIMMIFFLTIKFHCVQSAHSSQLTAHSSQLTAHSSQLTKSSFNQNNILFYNNKFINKKSSLGIWCVFSLHSVAALFLCFASGVSTVFCETK